MDFLIKKLKIQFLFITTFVTMKLFVSIKMNNKPWLNSECFTNDSIIDEIRLNNEEIYYFEIIKNLTTQKEIEFESDLKLQIRNFDKFYNHRGIELFNIWETINIKLSKLQFYNQNLTEINEAQCKIDNFKKFNFQINQYT